jgi:uncharacterized protein RhaS with RHS repeats
VYIADGTNNRVQEVPVAAGTQWGQAMTANDMYTVAGSAAGHAGNSGDGGPATTALLNDADGVAVDPAGDLYITDDNNWRLREVISSTTATITADPLYGASALYPIPGTTVGGTTYPGGITVTQPGGAQVTFWPQTGGSCTSPQVAAGGYCVVPQDEGASLTAISGISYTFTPSPGGTTYTYSWTGALTTETDPAGDALTITGNSPAPGTGNCPSSATTCQTITSASGRALVIGSNSAGRVTSVTDPLARRWTYAYTGPDLASVTFPASAGSRVTSYTYGAGTNTNPLLANDLLTITGPNAQPGGPDAGDDTANAYDNYGRVTSQTDPAGWTTTFSY